MKIIILVVIIVSFVIGGVWYLNAITPLSADDKAIQNSADVLNGEPSTQDKYEISYDVELNNPTYTQVKDILKELKGVKIEGNCLDKSKYVQDYSYNKGIQCYVVVSNFKDLKGHATVAFYTEKGWVYVEPDGMVENKMAQGLPYYIPNRAYEGPVGMTAKEFVENNTVSQMVIFR